MSKKKPQTYHLHKVDWEDAASSGSWVDLGKEEITPLKVTSVGYLISDGKERLVLAQSLTNNQRSADRIQIPKKWIKRNVRIRGHKVVYDD